MKRLIFYVRTKHIQLQYHRIKGLIDDGTLRLEKDYRTKNSISMLTIVLPISKLRLGMTSISLPKSRYWRHRTMYIDGSSWRSTTREVFRHVN